MALIPRGSSCEVKKPFRCSWAETMCSKVDSQCVSHTTTVSGFSRSKASDFSRRRPSTRLISLPSLISSRTSSGSMMVGTWDTSPAPTIRSEEHTSELQSRRDLVCRLLLEKKKKKIILLLLLKKKKKTQIH